MYYECRTWRRDMAHPYDTSITYHRQGEYAETINEKHQNRLIFSSKVVKIGLNMYTAILRRVLSTYTIILRRVNRMKIFIFVYIRRLGSLVAQGIGGLDRSCFGTRNRNGVGGYRTCFSTQNRYDTEGRIRSELVKVGRTFIKCILWYIIINAGVVQFFHSTQILIYP